MSDYHFACLRRRLTLTLLYFLDHDTDMISLPLSLRIQYNVLFGATYYLIKCKLASVYMLML